MGNDIVKLCGGERPIEDTNSNNNNTKIANNDSEGVNNNDNGNIVNKSNDNVDNNNNNSNNNNNNSNNQSVEGSDVVDNPLEGIVCVVCDEPFALDGSQEVVNFDEQYYHHEHFKCWHCGIQLDSDDATPVVYKDRLWCGEDYARALKKREKKRKCASCSKKIKQSEEPVIALNKSWHKDCLKCVNCKRVLEENNIFHETGEFQSGDPIYCRKHFLDRFADRCASCALPLKGGAICKLAGRTFHSECFKCSECRQPLREKFCLKDDIVYCKKDFDRLFGLKCFRCDETLEGKFQNAFGRLYHQKCFTCISCGERLKGARFDKDPDSDDLYCEEDYKKLLRERHAKESAKLYNS